LSDLNRSLIENLHVVEPAGYNDYHK
jgi:hypothetical protein